MLVWPLNKQSWGTEAWFHGPPAADDGQVCHSGAGNETVDMR